MDTQEMTREGAQQSRQAKQPAPEGRTAPPRQRSAAKEGTPRQRRQAPQGARRSASAGARRPDGAAKRQAPPRSAAQESAVRTREGDAPARKQRPPQRSAAPRKAPPAKAAKPAGSGYQPYKKAKNKQRAARNRNFARQVSRFFSYENPVLKLFSKPEPDVFGDSNATRRELKAQQEARRKKRALELNTPAVIYTQPRTFNRNRLAIQLMTVLAVVLALVLGISVFFKVEVITVSGANVYSAWTVREASGIKEGENLLTFGRTRASGQIIANLPYVKSARIGIKLPDTVNIEIEEERVVYAIQDSDSVWWLIDSGGKIIEQTSSVSAKNYTRVLGVSLFQPRSGEQAVATEDYLLEEATADPEAETLDPMFTEAPILTGASRLNAALHILQALENNDIVGDAASVDVTRLEDIILWYGTQYQVNLGGTEKMDYKIACLNDVLLQMRDYQSGILDISFTTWADQVGYTPFG